jgi:Flp pilus assembly pilin Flp
MRRAQSTLEYAFLIGIVAVAITAMLVYMKRGFQGNLRQLSEQVGAGSYDPKNTTVNNTETKHTVATVTSSDASTVTYGTAGSQSTSGTSKNTETGTETVNRSTSEAVGNLSGDTWHN